MATVLYDAAGVKAWSDEPFGRVPLRCRLGLHRWARMSCTRGLSRRGVVARSGCLRCGRILLRRAGFWGGGSYQNGYVDPAAVAREAR